jgi:hypothetical protein
MELSGLYGGDPVHLSNVTRFAQHSENPCELRNRLQLSRAHLGERACNMSRCETGGHLTECSLLHKIVADGCVTSGDTAQGMFKICFRRAKDLLRVCIARTRDHHGRLVFLETRWMLACYKITHGRHGTSLGATGI